FWVLRVVSWAPAGSRAPAAARKGCDGGKAADCVELGLRHVRGDGVPQDRGSAPALCKKACALEDAAGCFDLGLVSKEQPPTPARAATKDLQGYQRRCDGG